jgi:hypothetical protein
VGRARIYHGSSAGLDEGPYPDSGYDIRAENRIFTSELGCAVASAGDVNGDGFADVLVGARLYADGSNPGEGKAFFYFGGGGDGLEFRPRQQLVGSTTRIAQLGATDEGNRFRIRAWGRPPFGRGQIRMEWERKPLGQPFTGIGTMYTSWRNSTAYGYEFNEVVTGMTDDTPYHWRIRFHYHPNRTPLQVRGRWMTIPIGGWNETDFRTPGCRDADFDGFGSPPAHWCPGGLEEDCDNYDDRVYPGSPEVCDGVNNDCDDPTWPDPIGDDVDADSDDVPVCAGDCHDGNAAIYPDAPWACDGVNNDCNDPTYPAVPADELDVDGDGLFTCQGDCNDADGAIHPSAGDGCDGIDNDCDGYLDEGCDRQCDEAGRYEEYERVSNGVSDSEFPAMVWTGTEYGVAWGDFRHGNAEIYFARLDASGTLVPGSEVRVTDNPGDSEQPSLAWTGTEYGIAWHDDRDGDHEIFFKRIDAAGVPVPASEVWVTSDAFDSQYPSLVWTGYGYGIAWQDLSVGSWEIFFTRLSTAGIPDNPGTRVSFSDPANAANPELVWNGDGYGVAWRDKRHGNYEIYFAPIDADGVPGTNNRITNDSGYSSELSLVWTGDGYGVAWNDTRHGDWEVFFARIDAAGVKIGSDVLITNDDAFDSWYPTVAWSGSEYGLVWQDNRSGENEVYFARLDATGARIGPETRITDVGDSRDPQIVWDGYQFGVAWHDYRSTIGNWEIFFSHVECCDDVDGDAWHECLDCDDTDGATYPMAPETNDGVDNQCPGDPGYGIVDEVAADAGYPDPDNPDRFSWTPQPGATMYEVARSTASDFSGACDIHQTSDTWWDDTDIPAPGTEFHYLVRVIQPFVGSWGLGEDGLERLEADVCP